jgi:hypothetical protein
VSETSFVTASDIVAFQASPDAFMHLRNASDSSKVVKLIRQSGGGLAIRQPDGSNEVHTSPEIVAQRVNAVLGLSTPKPSSARYTFKDKHRGGMHVLFTTDENQVVVVWRTRVPDTNEIETVSATIWAAWNEGEIGGYDMSERQQDWLGSLMEEANAWTGVLEQRGKLLSTGGRPDPAPRFYSVPVRTARGTTVYRNIRSN